MGKSTAWANGLIQLLFTNVAVAKIGDAAGLQPAGAAGNLYISLHTADPGIAGDQTTSETAYTGYARVAVPRTGAGWTIVNGNVVNAAVITFPLCTGGSSTIAFWGIGTDGTLAGKLLYSYPLVTTWFEAVAERTTDKFHAPGSAFSASDPVILTVSPGATMPVGVSAGTIYFVKTVSDTDEFTLSATVGGAALDITVDGSCLLGKITTLAVSINIGPAFAINQLSLTES